MANDGKAKGGRHPLTNVVPCMTAVVASVKAEVVLQIEALRLTSRGRNLVHTLPELWILVGQEVGADTLIRRTPAHAIVGSINPSGGNADHHSRSAIYRWEDGVKTKPASARLPLGPMRVVE